MSANLLYFGNDHAVTLTGATGDGDALTAATVTWSVLDSAGAEEATGSMAHAGDGTYTGTIEAADLEGLTLGDEVTIVVTLAQGGYDAQWRQRRRLTTRSFRA